MPEATEIEMRKAQARAELQRLHAQSTANLVRTMRTQKLQKSDWTQLADAPVNSAVWAAYRQALRDVPAQDGFPHAVEWPQEPA
jgi:hypothetical protein